MATILTLTFAALTLVATLGFARMTIENLFSAIEPYDAKEMERLLSRRD